MRPNGQRFQFPKSVRILKSKEYRRVYDNGFRVSGRTLVGFCLRDPEVEGHRVGITTSKALGRAVIRNRIRRRIREAIRKKRGMLASGWLIVINGRRAALDAPFAAILDEVERVFSRCAS